MPEGFFLESLARYVGQTVTIFTTSGGLSGSGFTGVLAGISDCFVKLITDIGAAPACPIGSNCDCGGWNNGNWGFGGYGNGWGNCGCNNRWDSFYGSNWLGSVTEIPIDRIASFTHNAI